MFIYLFYLNLLQKIWNCRVGTHLLKQWKIKKKTIIIIIIIIRFGATLAVLNRFLFLEEHVVSFIYN